MSDRSLTPADKLILGDWIQVAGWPDAEVIEIEAAERIVRKQLLIVTVRRPDGSKAIKNYHPNSTVAIRDRKGDSSR